MSFKILPISAFKDNYIWLITIEGKKNGIVVDPGDATPVLNALKTKQITLSAILLTHHHGDHTDGVKELLKHYPVPVYGPAHDNIPTVTHLLNDNDQINFPELNLSLRAIDIPGHTRGHIALANDEMLFCGDTLFTGGCGRLFEGTAEQLFTSLNKLAALPDNTAVYCGHEYTQNNLRFAHAVEPNNVDLQQRMITTKELRDANLPTVPSTILLEKKTNPFLRCHVPAVIKAAEQYAGHPLKDAVSVFACLRRWKDSF